MTEKKMPGYTGFRPSEEMDHEGMRRDNRFYIPGKFSSLLTVQ